MNNVIVLAGPTASGKTRLAVELALKYDGEVVSADSMQIYRKMDIGTAKPSREEMKGIPHHMIDILEPLEDFNVVQYQKMARECIEDIIARGKMPILAGGTGFYINSVIYNTNFAENEKNEAFREKLAREAELYGNEYLHEKLREVDPEAAAKIHKNNVKRVIRALEVYEFSKKKFSDNLIQKQLDPGYNFIIIGLNPERSYLYERINKRVDQMLEEGLLEETRKLYEQGYLEGKTASAAIGYKELLPYIKGELSLEEAVENLKKATRNYAKRQMTWFRRIPEIHWIDYDRESGYEEIFQKAVDIIENNRV